jgi:hypothetical protein
LNEVGIQGQNNYLRLEDEPKVLPYKEPNKILTLVLFMIAGGIAGLFLGLGYIVLTSTFDRTFFRTRELTSLTGVPCYQTAFLHTKTNRPRSIKNLVGGDKTATKTLKVQKVAKSKVEKASDDGKKGPDRELVGNKSE